MKRLILAGGGHAHLHVLKSLAERNIPGVEVILISPYIRQVYSGMLPGWMACHYSLGQCVAALEPLVKAAQARFIQDIVIDLDVEKQTVRTAHSGDFAYDVLSLDTGAFVDNSMLAATGAILLPIRPLEDFIAGWIIYMDQCRERRQAQLAVVGGGAAGVELVLAARYRLNRELGTSNNEVSLIAGRELLAGHGPSVIASVRRCLAASEITIVDGYAAGSENGLMLDDGAELPVDCVISATGAVPSPWLAESGLCLADDGFVAVGETQQSISHANVFAGGDVASRIDTPHPKSGVYAVRAGPVLAANLRSVLSGEKPRPYRPQKRSLYLLATGPKHAIMSWNGIAVGGHWVWRWKDWIDRRFMKQYHSPNGVNERK